ncbi:MAG TPA: DNA gyrase modulator, partial [Candidatus Wallbacteria bacterium]|nr:DNA gyrase modulator [Candidatus Wallbacteria bacterium]
MAHSKKAPADFGAPVKFMEADKDSKILKTIYEGSASIYKNEKIYLISRIQKKKALSVTIINGELSDITSSSRCGAGIHAFDQSGASAFISSNTFPQIDFAAMCESLKKLIASSSAYDIKRNKDIFKLEAQV